jgi:hypothetical protein
MVYERTTRQVTYIFMCNFLHVHEIHVYTCMVYSKNFPWADPVGVQGVRTPFWPKVPFLQKSAIFNVCPLLLETPA